MKTWTATVNDPTVNRIRAAVANHEVTPEAGEALIEHHARHVSWRHLVKHSTEDPSRT
jgi:hypothetical protein